MPVHGTVRARFSSNLFDSRLGASARRPGRVTDIVELPFAWVLDDAPFFSIAIGCRANDVGTIGRCPIMDREWDGISTEPGTHYMLAMHPQVIDRLRLWALEQTLTHIMESGNAEFLRCSAYADRMRPLLLEERNRQS